MDLPALGEENLAKQFGGKRQKLNVEPSPNQREREREKKSLKQFRLIKTNRGLHKFSIAISIDQRTGSIDRNC